MRTSLAVAELEIISWAGQRKRKHKKDVVNHI
jgi:hypothetical protein